MLDERDDLQALRERQDSQEDRIDDRPAAERDELLGIVQVALRVLVEQRRAVREERDHP